MRKKISAGFVCLAFVLLFAGAISMYEMHRLRGQALGIIEDNTYNTALADKMLTALQKQNSSLLRMIFSDATTPDAEFHLGQKSFDEAVEAATALPRNSDFLQPVIEANTAFLYTIEQHLKGDGTPDIDWFVSSYLQAYYRLDDAIRDYFTSPANPIAARAQILEKSAYKTITPSIVTLLIALIIVLMFFFFINAYYTRPLLEIHKSLKNYLNHKIPFDPKCEGSEDEIDELKGMIEELIERKKNERR